MEHPTGLVGFARQQQQKSATNGTNHIGLINVQLVFLNITSLHVGRGKQIAVLTRLSQEPKAPRN